MSYYNPHAANFYGVSPGRQRRPVLGMVCLILGNLKLLTVVLGLVNTILAVAGTGATTAITVFAIIVTMAMPTALGIALAVLMVIAGFRLWKGL